MTVLVAIDEEHPADPVVSLAYDIATTYGVPLVALHVIPQEDFESHIDSIQSIPEFEDFSIEHEEDNAARFASRVVETVLGEFDQDVVRTRGRIGDPAEEILAEAGSIDPRFLVIGARRRSPVGKAIFGSTTQKILLNAECPVVTARVG